MEKENKKTKILAVGDIHGDRGLVKKLAEKAEKEKVDLVIMAGDITLANQEFKEIIAPFLRINKEVILIPGNHEPISTAQILEEVYPNVKNIHGYSIKKDNLGIFGAGGADIGLLVPREKDIFSMLEKGNSYLNKQKVKKKIMVTHLQPKGTLIEKIGGFKGSSAIRKAIEKFQPDIAINAHLHLAGGIEEKIGKTKVINVSRKAKIIEI
jgi:Icc-related predicted phosphoesterase